MAHIQQKHSDDFRKTCQICYNPFSRKSTRVAIKCYPSKHQLCSTCIDGIIEDAQTKGRSPLCPFDRIPFSEDDLIFDPTELTSIDAEEDVHRKNSHQLKENKTFEEVCMSIFGMGERLLSKSTKENLIRNAGFKVLAIKFKAAQKDLNKFVEVRAIYIELLERKALKLRLEQVVKGFSILVEAVGISLALTSGGTSLLLCSGGAAALRFATTMLLQKVFSDNEKIVQCTEECKELAERPAIQEFILALQNTEQYLNGKPSEDLLTALGLGSVAFLLTQASTIAVSVLQFLGPQAFTVCGELLAILGISFILVGAAITGKNIHNLELERKQILEMIKVATDQQDSLNRCMETVKKDPRFVEKLESEVEAQPTNDGNTVAHTKLEDIPLTRSLIIPQSQLPDGAL